MKNQLSSIEDKSILCLRDDLEISFEGELGRHITIIKDPRSGRFFRFAMVEAFILQQLDGDTALDTIQHRTAQKFGAQLSLKELEGFIDSLHQRRLLSVAQDDGVMSTASTSEKAPLSDPVQGRVRGTLLYKRFKLLDPDHKLDWLEARIRFCFTRGFVVASFWIMLFALMTFMANSDEISRDFMRVFQPGNILPAVIIILATTIGHEFAHGVTCKHYGGHVHEMGFLLLFFQPALYCNVSDAWLVPEKSKRMWVGMAGTYFEMVLWAVSVFVWRITTPDAAINFAALAIIGISGFRLFLNLNPLIKLDGYYVLSDWLEIPNLRTRAFAFIWIWARRPWALSRINLPSREKRIYLYYGLMGMAFMVWILSFITSLVAGFLTDQLQGIGFILFVCLLLLIFKTPLVRLKVKIFGQKHTIAPEESREQQA